MAGAVCRKFSISASVLYRRRAAADRGSASALKQEGKRGKPMDSEQSGRRDAELDRMRAVIAEITAENLALKKRVLCPVLAAPHNHFAPVGYR